MAERGRWLRGLELDLRSLGLFRIALGLCVLADLFVRIPYLDDFYTDGGIVPRVALFDGWAAGWALSLHFASGHWSVQLILFLAAAMFALGLTVGYRTRFCAVATWLLVTSMQVRNPLILHAGDDLLRMLLFWSMFVPLHARFSLDRAMNPSVQAARGSVLTPGSLALIFQICAMYWYTAAEKMHPIWIDERTAVYYALNLDQFATGFGRMLLQWPAVLPVLTTGTLILEAFGPLLAISPVATGRLRLVAVAMFVSFHIGLGLSLHLGLFPWVCIAAWLVFLPAEFWSFLRRRIQSFGRDTTIYVDGDCTFCRQSVEILRALLRLDETIVVEAQGDPAAFEAMRSGRSWVVRDSEGRQYTGYLAFVALCRVSPVARWLVWLIGSPPAQWMGERIYRLISADRTGAARRLAAILPPAPRTTFGLLSSLLPIIALVLVEAALSRRPTMGLQSLRLVEPQLISLTQLGQSWRMFAPYPDMEDGWYVIEGVTNDGRRLDVWNDGGEPSYARPDDFWSLYRNSQWQKYLTNMWQRRNKGFRPYLGTYLCREWNQAHDPRDQIELVYVNYMLEETPPPGEPKRSAERQSVLRHTCAPDAPSQDPGE
jgi:predicted DCC family thiol-disulfide oxidoreductase YuxK